ncbi:hypothetical protein TNCV_4933081 [Trichonephila clavipes]|nr:hypothetical protein TNCV_4933081 [Trichonephila clavipes]
MRPLNDLALSGGSLPTLYTTAPSRDRSLRGGKCFVDMDETSSNMPPLSYCLEKESLTGQLLLFGSDETSCNSSISPNDSKIYYSSVGFFDESEKQ